jgi:hypothetical protein
MNELAEKIYKIMEPKTSLMAKPILENNCIRIGKSSDTINRDDLALLLPKIERGIAFFFDEKVAAETTKKD